jgi:16S rRNA (cytosine967-C5)-methyltransferase
MSHPDFLVGRWLARFGREATLALLTANNRDKPVQLLAFRDRGGRELLAEALIDEGIEVEPSPLSPLGLTVRRGNPLASPAFARGDFYIQDEASQAAGWVPPPLAGERVLDAAAAPGGKTFALLAR